MFLPIHRISSDIQRGSVRRQGVVLPDNELHPLNLRMSSLERNCLYISLMFSMLFVQLYNTLKAA